MIMRFPSKRIWAFAVLVLVTATPFAEDRLVINVSKARQSQPSAQVIHYQGAGSVRHSEQRTYESAQARHSTQGAQNRRESQGAQTRRTAGAQDRREVPGAERRTYSQATDRHGSVRLDTIR
jgi:hypothetical protein